jgi:hypothetical protein
LTAGRVWVIIKKKAARRASAIIGPYNSTRDRGNRWSMMT